MRTEPASKLSLILIAMWLWLGSSTLLHAAESKPEPAAPKMSIAVVEFSIMGELDEQTGAIIADLMMADIANSGYFNLKDRLPLSAVSKIAKSQELGYTGLLDPRTAADLGKHYGLDAVVIGAVSKLGETITVTARLIDTKTALLLRSGQVQANNIGDIPSQINKLASTIAAPVTPIKTYALTVNTEPANAGVRLLNNDAQYQPGMRLAAGDYELEVQQPGYAPRRETVKIADRDVVTKVTLEKAKYGLTIQPNPADAQIRLLNSKVAYKPGMELLPGDYQVEVSKAGYTAQTLPVKIVDTALNLPVSLEKPPEPVLHHLTLQPDPPQATVKLLNNKAAYQPGMVLAPGTYQVEVSQAGYETQKTSVTIADSDVTMPVALTKLPEPAKIEQYRLTVQPDPANAKVRLLGSKSTYKPGVSLAPGRYSVEVSQAGYETQKTSVTIANSDVTMPVALTKLPEPPKIEQYRLTVRTDPANAKVRLLGSKSTYKPGVSLAPGRYSVEVSQAGYEAQKTSVTITDSDVTVPVALTKLPEPPKIEQYRLTVQPDPANAKVRLLGSKSTYRPGVSLAPGRYSVEVSQAGYEAQKTSVTITDSDVTMPVALTKLPEPPKIEQYRLTVRTDPADARVRLLNSASSYRPGGLVPPGNYTVEVSRRGYETQRQSIEVADRDVTESVTLEEVVKAEPPPMPAKKPEQPPALVKAEPEPPPPATRPGTWRIGSVQVDGSISGVDRSEVQRILSRHVGSNTTRNSLLDSAMQVYRSTGITLSFAVHNAASGSAQLSARVSQRQRRTYESSVPLITRGQLEQSGFSVSAD